MPLTDIQIKAFQPRDQSYLVSDGRRLLRCSAQRIQGLDLWATLRIFRGPPSLGNCFDELTQHYRGDPSESDRRDSSSPWLHFPGMMFRIQ